MRKQQSTSTKPRRRWIVIGPGLILAAILGLQVAISNHKAASAPPIIERQVIGATSTAAPVLPRDIPYIIGQAGRLKLSAAQRKSLSGLVSKWNVESHPLSEQMDEAAKEFQTYMKGADGKASMQDVQSHAGRVSELSRQMSSLRRIYWERGLQVLDAGQRRDLEKGLVHR